jgi:hypothetical protein
MSSNRYKTLKHQKPGLALGLLFLFVLLTAFCPVRKIFFPQVITFVNQQQVKFSVKPPTSTTNLSKSKSAGICGLEYMKFKRTSTLSSLSVSSSICIPFIAANVVLFLTFQPFKDSRTSWHKKKSTFHDSTPIFILYQHLLI